MATALTSRRKNALRGSTASENEKGVAREKSSTGAACPRKPFTATAQPANRAARIRATASFRALDARTAIKIRGTSSPRTASRKTNAAPVAAADMGLFPAPPFLHFLQHLPHAHELVVKDFSGHVQ